jgi:site-specific DNA-methyltransferase (adenine-specific)
MIISKEQYNKLPEHLKNYFEEFKNIHPTVKNIKLMSYLITLGSKKEDIILDPFMGSGSTGVAAKMLGRKFIGIELSEDYLKIAQERIKNAKF